MTVTQNATTFDPKVEADRERQRSLEREIRASKRDASIAPNDLKRQKALREVKDAQKELRARLDETGRKRAAYREQLGFSDGR